MHGSERGGWAERTTTHAAPAYVTLAAPEEPDARSLDPEAPKNATLPSRATLTLYFRLCNPGHMTPVPFSVTLFLFDFFWSNRLRKCQAGATLFFSRLPFTSLWDLAFC